MANWTKPYRDRTLYRFEGKMRYARYALISRSVLPFYSNSLYLRT